MVSSVLSGVGRCWDDRCLYIGLWSLHPSWATRVLRALVLPALLLLLSVTDFGLPCACWTQKETKSNGWVTGIVGEANQNVWILKTGGVKLKIQSENAKLLWKFPYHGLSLTIIRFFPIICKHMLDWFHIHFGFLLALFHLHWGLYLQHLCLERNKGYTDVKNGLNKKSCTNNESLVTLLSFETMPHCH